MRPEIVQKRDALAVLCQRYGVARLEVFGSGARGDDFDPQRSDIDFLVEFGADCTPTLELFFGLEADLSALFGRRVDLVQPSAIRNPYVLESIEQTREPVYGA